MKNILVPCTTTCPYFLKCSIHVHRILMLDTNHPNLDKSSNLKVLRRCLVS